MRGGGAPRRREERSLKFESGALCAAAPRTAPQKTSSPELCVRGGVPLVRPTWYSALLAG